MPVLLQEGWSGYAGFCASGVDGVEVSALYVGNDVELMSALRKALGTGACVLVSCADRESAITFLKSDIPSQLLLIDFEWREREGLKLGESGTFAEASKTNAGGVGDTD